MNDFTKVLAEYYAAHGRHDLPWRAPESDGTYDAYKIIMSEYMLQQTQVPRVIPKYRAFLVRFPDITSLAAASLGEVLIAWQGLGYNRRAKYLWQTARTIVEKYGGQVPAAMHELTQLPGIGVNTAGAIVAYAFNQPVVFVETNIRSVYIHHFFRGKTDIADSAILPLIEQSIDRANPRVFYWSLMDYGTHLKSQKLGQIAHSRHYTKQSKFDGSARQIRGQIIRLLAAQPLLTHELLQSVGDTRAPQIIHDLAQEGLLVRRRGKYRLA